MKIRFRTMKIYGLDITSLVVTFAAPQAAQAYPHSTICPPSGVSNYNTCNFAGWWAVDTQPASYYDQADASWDDPHATPASLSGFARWVGLYDPSTGYLFQAGEQATATAWAKPYWEIYGGPCSTHGYYNPPSGTDGISAGDRIYTHVIIKDSTHFRVYMQDQTPGHTWTWDTDTTGGLYCPYAWEYTGTQGEFIDERPLALDGNGNCIIVKLETHNSNDILSPRIHVQGELGSTYHYLSTQSPTFMSMYDDQLDPFANPWHLENVGSLGSNSNFSLSFVSNGTTMSSTGCGA